jgi:hypothetical protein
MYYSRYLRKVLLAFKFQPHAYYHMFAAETLDKRRDQDVVCFVNYIIPLQRNQGYIVYETSKQWYCFYIKNI